MAIQLTPYQAKVKQRMRVTSEGDIITLRGYAGTGKTVVVADIVRSAKSSSKIGVIAPTLTALSVVRSRLSEVDANLTYLTVAKLTKSPYNYVEIKNIKFELDDDGIAKLEKFMTKLKLPMDDIVIEREFMRSYRGERRIEKEYLINDIALREALRGRFKDKVDEMDLTTQTGFRPLPVVEVAEKLKKFNLVVIDEMPMVSQATVEQIEEAVDYLKTNKEPCPRILLSGDPSQLEPIEGEINHYMTDAVNDDTIFELTEILRSTDNVAKLGALLKRGVPLEKIANASKDVIRFRGNAEQFIQEHPDEIAQADVILTLKNVNVRAFNSHARKVKGYDGISNVQEGETLLVTKNTAEIERTGEVEFINGSEHTVKRILNSDTAITILNEDVRFKDARAFNDPSHGEYIENCFERAVSILKSGIYVMAILVDVFGDEHYCFLERELRYSNSVHKLTIENNMNEISHLCGEFCPVVRATFGYARTVDKSQGSEWKSVLYVVTSGELWFDKKPNRPYTAITRAKENIRVYILDN